MNAADEGSLRHGSPPAETNGAKPEPISRAGRQSGELHELDTTLAFS
ncbi:hypothetical protein [Streptomyces sp. CB01881]|nr:hypothetical protein [Streptomyces sp. CB01881]